MNREQKRHLNRVMKHADPRVEAEQKEAQAKLEYMTSLKEAVYQTRVNYSEYFISLARSLLIEATDPKILHTSHDDKENLINHIFQLTEIFRIRMFEYREKLMEQAPLSPELQRFQEFVDKSKQLMAEGKDPLEGLDLSELMGPEDNQAPGPEAA